MKLPQPKLNIDYVPCVGGDDLVSTPFEVKPGRAIFTQNYELDVKGRYRLLDGYERFDGRPKPSDASYWILYFDLGGYGISEVEIEVDQTIEGYTSGATGEVLEVVLLSGSWDDADAVGYLVLGNVSGTFVDDEWIYLNGYAGHLYQESDALGDMAGTEADSTGNWNSYGLDGVGANVFDSVAYGPSNYNFQIESNDVPMDGARIWFDLSTLNLIEGQQYSIDVFAQHIGSGGEWTARLSSDSLASTVYTLITDLDNSDVTPDTYSRNFTYSSDTRYLVFRELSSTNDGGLLIYYIDVRAASLARVDGVAVEKGADAISGYWKVDFDAGDVEIEVGGLVQGVTSGATGEVLAVEITSGTWGDDAEGYLILYNVSGTFLDNEGIQLQGYTGELYSGVLNADAVADPGERETNSTGNWSDENLNGIGSNVFESQSSVVNAGSYAFHAESNDTPTASARFYLDIDTYVDLLVGKKYTISCDLRHVGVGGEWYIGLSPLDTLWTVDNEDLATLYDYHTTFVSYSAIFTYSTMFRYFGGRELSVTNDGGIYLDNLSITAEPLAYVNGSPTEVKTKAEVSDILDHAYLLLSIENRRDDIDAVPGSGNILGVHQYNGVKYAFRNNSGGTAAIMYKSTTSGWVECDLGERLGFDTGSAEFVEGETVTQGAVTAVVRRVIVQDGTWGGSDAEGYFVITGRSGGNFSAGAMTGSISGAANAIGAQTENAFSVPSGRFEFVNENFRGHSETIRMYGCDGANKAFEWDGTYFCPIETGMTTDTPSHIAAFKKHLFLMFSGGSIQHSSLGEPCEWDAVTGANELGIGDEGTGFLSLPNVLVCFARNSTRLLYGTSVADWELRPHGKTIGAREWTSQEIGNGIYLDDRGLTSLAASEKYGDFIASILSRNIHPYLKTKMTEIQSSVIVRSKNQYRLFFTDSTAITLTLDGDKVVGFTRQFYDHLPVCVTSGENTDGEEEIYFGSTNGYVYQMDVGNSFDGEAIEAIVKFHFNNLKTPSTKKRIRKLTLELTSPIETFLNASVEFDYGETYSPGSYYESLAKGGIWDLDYWGTFIWDGASIASQPLDVSGSGLNFSLTIYHSGVFELQENEYVPRSGITNAGSHTIQGYLIHYDLRGVQR